MHRTPQVGKRRIAAAGCALIGLLTLASSAFGLASFQTPGGAAYCGWSEGEPPEALICWTPNDGYTIGMFDWGRPTRGTYERNNRGYEEPYAPMLRFGRTIRWGVTRCASRSTGLTCTNGDGHGWWLGRYHGLKRF